MNSTVSKHPDLINAANGLKGDPDRLYVLLPYVYRERDAEKGYPLRAILRVIAEQVEVVEDDIARLYENWFIETCDDWVVPYIGELVGAPMSVRSGEPSKNTDPRALARERRIMPRAEVADWIRSLRRKGTLSLLEDIARTSADWPARAVEFYRLIGWHAHLDHLRPGQGETANLREGSRLARIGGPFDDLARTVDVRRPDSIMTPGLYNVPSVGLFLWRLRPYTVTNAPAYRAEDVGQPAYEFSVLGGDCALFNHPIAAADVAHGPARPAALPIRITRRVLERRITDAQGRLISVASPNYYGADKSIAVYAPDWPARGAPQPVPASKVLVADLSGWRYNIPRGFIAVDPETGRILFPVRQPPKESVSVRYNYGFSADMGGGEYPRLVTQPDHARVYRVAKSAVASGAQENPPILDSILAAHDMWRRDRDADQAKTSDPTHTLTPDEEDRKNRPAAVIEVEDSDEYTERLDIALVARESLEIRASDGARPVIRLLDYRANRSDALRISGGADGRFTLDGIWIIGRGLVIDGDIGDESMDTMAELLETIAENDRPDSDESWEEGPTDEPVREPVQKSGKEYSAQKGHAPYPTGEVKAEYPVKRSGLCEVRIRDCTLVPGWGLHTNCDPRNPDEPSIELVNTDAGLIIERSIIGSIQVSVSETQQEPVSISLSDSIVDATSNDRPALESPTSTSLAYARVTARRCTFFGTVSAHAIDLAENCLFCGTVTVGRRQEGCVRFSYVPFGSRTPHRFRCQPDGVTSETGPDNAENERRRVSPRFTSTRYGSPAYAQLAYDCAPEITGGAEDESEMGAFHDLYAPQREALLRERLADCTPEDRDAGLIFID